eukprot:TRINITY_DN15085_c0_g1_i1.p1 TRINITY_DN15085_c0_g1~~TRINITY_DN15085_c0_g1_i1.p1  ORF type:complete len:213 (-),score=17.55 TRINITY_DN15085_c0_g1_i1:114-752(-)
MRVQYHWSIGIILIRYSNSSLGISLARFVSLARVWSPEKWPKSPCADMSLSSRLQSMRFMQRAKAKDDVKKKEDELPSDDSHWIAPVREGNGGAECMVVVEGDPKPGALLGRMSFKSYNPVIEKLSEDAEESAARREGKGTAALHSKKEASVSDAEMAVKLSIKKEAQPSPDARRGGAKMPQSIRGARVKEEQESPQAKRQKVEGARKQYRT